MKQAGERSDSSRPNIRTRAKQAVGLAVGAAALLTGCHGGESSSAPQESRTPSATASAPLKSYTSPTPKPEALPAVAACNVTPTQEKAKDPSHPGAQETQHNAAFIALTELQACIQAEWKSLPKADKEFPVPGNDSSQTAAMLVPTAAGGYVRTFLHVNSLDSVQNPPHVGDGSTRAVAEPNFADIDKIETGYFPGNTQLTQPKADLSVSVNNVNLIRDTAIIAPDENGMVRQLVIKNDQELRNDADGNLVTSPDVISNIQAIAQHTVVQAGELIGTQPGDVVSLSGMNQLLAQ